MSGLGYSHLLSTSVQDAIAFETLEEGVGTMALKWPPPVSSDSNGGIPVAGSLLQMRAGQGVLKSWVRGERLVCEWETMGTGGSDGGGEIPAAGTDTERCGSGGEGGGVHGKKGRD